MVGLVESRAKMCFAVATTLVSARTLIIGRFKVSVINCYLY